MLIVKTQKTKTEEGKLLFVGQQKLVRSRRFKLNQGMVEVSGLRPADSGYYVCRLQLTPPIEVSLVLLFSLS